MQVHSRNGGWIEAMLTWVLLVTVIRIGVVVRDVGQSGSRFVGNGHIKRLGILTIVGQLHVVS